MTDYDFTSIDMSPLISVMYQDISSSYKINNLNTSYFNETITVKGVTTTRCPLLNSVWNTLVNNFDLYYATREIGGESEYDFFNMMQSCLNRNADTFERQLEVYWDDIAKPILGRTEVVTYDTLDSRDYTSDVEMSYGKEVERAETGEETNHHVEVPANEPTYDTDRTRDKLNFDNRKTTDTSSGTDSSEQTDSDTRSMTGTVTTELSDIGVRPNYESMNGFLDKNRTFIQFFIDKFEECFAPRYRRVFF